MGRIDRKYRRKRKKDPNHPKRPKTAFMFFSIATRPVVLSEMPGISFTDIGSEIGRRWGELDENEKVEYMQQAEADAARYHKAMQNYDKPPVEYIKGKRRKDPNAPKRAMSAYLYYCDEFRQMVRSENPSKSIAEVAKILGEMWRALPEDQKTPYREKAAKDRARYMKIMESYRQKKAEQKQKEKAAKKRGKPKKKAKSSSNHGEIWNL